MSLKLIIGPPNSGRTGAVLDGFRAAAERAPVLVVPTVDDVERFEERGAEAGEYEREIAGLSSAFAEVRDELGRHDDHTLAAAATTALRTRPDTWEGRPVFLYGFDDLTREQVELVLGLAVTSPT